MVNKYIKKRGERYSPQLLQKALTLVSNGQSIRSVAKQLCIQPMFLCRYIKKQNSNEEAKKPGRTTALPAEVEKSLAEHLVTMAKWGFALTRNDVMNVTKEYVEQNALTVPFKENMPGKYWFIHFCQRNRLSLKNMERLEKCRRRATSDPFIIYEFYDIVEQELKSLELLGKPENIYNLDETCFCIDADKVKLVSGVGQKAYKQQEGTGRENITVMACVSAVGTALPPFSYSKEATFGPVGRVTAIFLAHFILHQKMAG